MTSLFLLRRSSRRIPLTPSSSSLSLSSSPLLLTTSPGSSLFSAPTVRWASIVASYAFTDSTCFSPPPPPMSTEQLQQVQRQKQQSKLEDQILLEQSQRIRQQTELQLQLSRHRNAILEQQSKQQQLYEQDLQERRRRQQQQLQQQQQKQHKENEKEDRELHQDTLASTTTRPSSNSPRQEGNEVEQGMMQQGATSLSKEEQSSNFVATRYRTMFGYRGPEHVQDAEPIHEEDEEVRLRLEKDEHAWSMTLPASPLSSLLSAEIRVQLAMMDYTPKHIDAMTLAEAQAILQPTTSTSTEATLSEPHMEECLSTTSTGAGSVSPPSIEESLSPVMETRRPLAYPADRGSGRYFQ